MSGCWVRGIIHTHHHPHLPEIIGFVSALMRGCELLQQCLFFFLDWDSSFPTTALRIQTPTSIVVDAGSSSLAVTCISATTTTLKRSKACVDLQDTNKKAAGVYLGKSKARVSECSCNVGDHSSVCVCWNMTSVTVVPTYCCIYLQVVMNHVLV